MPHCHNPDGIYHGIEGAKRLAREVGPALADFEDYEKLIGNTYSGICVMAYNLCPPIGASVWFAELRKGLAKAIEKGKS